jgi:hypothetical protein
MMTFTHDERIQNMVGTKQSRDELVYAYGNWLSEEMKRGWHGYLITFMYTQLRGSSSVILAQMFGEVERVYANLRTRIIRNSRSNADPNKMPRMIACPDFPVFKNNKQSLADVVINEGLHVHSLLLEPPWTRLTVPVDRHIADHWGLYLGRFGRLARIHVEPITHDPAYVTDYALKALKIGRVSGDELLILPRSSGEMGDGPVVERTLTGRSWS